MFWVHRWTRSRRRSGLDRPPSTDPLLPLLVRLRELVLDLGDAHLRVAQFGRVAVDLLGRARLVERLELGLERHDALLELLEEIGVADLAGDGLERLLLDRRLRRGPHGLHAFALAIALGELARVVVGVVAREAPDFAVLDFEDLGAERVEEGAVMGDEEQRAVEGLVAEVDFAGERREEAGENAQERGLAGAVLAHDADALAAADAQFDIAEEHLARVAAAEVARLEHPLARALGLLRADHGLAHVVVRAGKTREVGELLLAALGLGRALRAHVLPDEGLLLAQEVLLLLPGAQGGAEALVLLGDVGREVARVALELAVLELVDRVDRVLEQAPVVADDEHGALQVLDPLLDPFDAREVEVVRGLVEQQEIGAGDEHARERDPALLAARERGGLALPELRAQADAREHDFDVALGIPVRDGLELLVQAVLLGEQALELDALRAGDALVHELEFAAHGAQLLEPGFDEGAHADAGRELGPLRHIAQARALAQADRAPVGLLQALDHAQERRLAAAVAAHEADLVAGVDPQARAAQHLLRAEVLLKSVEVQQRHGRAEEDTRGGKRVRGPQGWRTPTSGHSSSGPTRR